MTSAKSEIEQREDGWWVVVANDGVDVIGPYSTKQEATEAQRGLSRFLRYEHEPGFITVEDL